MLLCVPCYCGVFIPNGFEIIAVPLTMLFFQQMVSSLPLFNTYFLLCKYGELTITRTIILKLFSHITLMLVYPRFWIFKQHDAWIFTKNWFRPDTLL